MDFLQKNAEISAIGYGRTYASDVSNAATGNLIYGRLGEKQADMARNTMLFRTSSSGVCIGDSGGAVFRRNADGLALVGVMVGGSSKPCGSVSSGDSFSTITIINKYGLLLDQAKAYAVSQADALNSKNILELKAEVDSLKTELLDSEAGYERTSRELENLKTKYEKCIKSARQIIKVKKGILPKGC